MHLSATTFIISSIFATVLSSAIYSSPSLQSLHMASSLSNLTLPANLSSVAVLNETRVRCNGDIYRRHLVESSCVDALSMIPTDTQLASFGTRGRGDFHINLPFRWISDDGLCVFDIYARHDNIVEVASMNDFHDAAENLVHECVTGRGDWTKGGIATGIGRHGQLGLIMTSYRPSVRCFNPPGEREGPDDCIEILLSMPAIKGYQDFGGGDSDIHLPLELHNDDRTCVAIVDIRGAPAVESWYRIWEEMVAIEGMCARNGLDGTAYALGSRRNMLVSVTRGAPGNVATS